MTKPYLSREKKFADFLGDRSYIIKKKQTHDNSA